MGKRKMKLSVEERVIVVKKVLNREVGLNKALKKLKFPEILSRIGVLFMKMKVLLD